jgi:D-lactate dehydrogenase (cytochrome)
MSAVHAETDVAAFDRGVLDRLANRFGERAGRAASLLEQHGGGEALRDVRPPDLVVFPETNEEVCEIVRACAEARCPIVPFGAGTSLEGHVQALQGGVCIDLTRMDRVLEVDPAALDCRVQAGVTREALNLHLRDQGLFFPIDPGANASIGGMASTRASGTNAVRYGTMREAVLGLTVVRPDGVLTHTGDRARKRATGLDLTSLYLGSEGTLGVITEIQLRLYGIPEKIAAAVCQFPSTAEAVDTVVAVLQLGVPIARIELMDALQMQASIAHSGLEGFEAKPSLFMEFHGSEASVADQVAQVEAMAQAFGGSGFRWAETTEERSALWKARHHAYYAALSLAPGKQGFATDACVPISSLAACIAECQADAQASGLICPVLGHVGDGNFHCVVLFDPDDAEERGRADAFAERTARRAIAFGGACSGEHGVFLH